jgi:mannose/fructose-specific phosphotransferase system component IIA
MILVILAVSIVLAIGFYIGYQYTPRDTVGESVCNVSWRVAVGLGSVVLVATLGLLIASICFSTVDQRITMYQEENTKIEQQIADVVKQYQEYESGVFIEVAPESSVTMVSLYPELKSDSLVQKQIDVYIANNNKIKTLKEHAIARSVVNWWLYFGE